jgi:hypothetical protein
MPVDDGVGGAVDVDFSQHRYRYRNSHGESRLANTSGGMSAAGGTSVVT